MFFKTDLHKAEHNIISGNIEAHVFVGHLAIKL